MERPQVWLKNSLALEAVLTQNHFFDGKLQEEVSSDVPTWKQRSFTSWRGNIQKYTYIERDLRINQCIFIPTYKTSDTDLRLTWLDKKGFPKGERLLAFAGWSMPWFNVWVATIFITEDSKEHSPPVNHWLLGCHQRSNSPVQSSLLTSTRSETTLSMSLKKQLLETSACTWAKFWLFLINQHLWLLDGHPGFNGNWFYFRSPGHFQGEGAVRSNSASICSWKLWSLPDLAGSARAWAKVTSPWSPPVCSYMEWQPGGCCPSENTMWSFCSHSDKRGAIPFFPTQQKSSLLEGTILDFITTTVNRRNRTKS